MVAGREGWSQGGGQWRHEKLEAQASLVDWRCGEAAEAVTAGRPDAELSGGVTGDVCAQSPSTSPCLIN